MINISINTDATQMAQRIGANKDKFMAKLPEILKNFVVRSTKSVLEHTYPVPGNNPLNGQGNSQAALAQAEKNIRQDVERSFETWDRAWVGDIIMQRNTEVLWNIQNPIQWRSPAMKKAWENQDIDALYAAFKNNGWKESDNVYVPNVSAADVLKGVAKGVGPRVFVQDKKAIDEIIEMKIKRVGLLAGGWVKALKKLGQAVASPFSGGSGGAAVTNNGLTVSAWNDNGDADGVMTKSGVIPVLVAKEENILKRDIVDHIRKSM